MVERKIIEEAIRNIEGETLLDKLIAVFPELETQAIQKYNNGFIDYELLQKQGVLVGNDYSIADSKAISASVFSK